MADTFDQFKSTVREVRIEALDEGLLLFYYDAVNSKDTKRYFGTLSELNDFLHEYWELRGW